MGLSDKLRSDLILSGDRYLVRVCSILSTITMSSELLIPLHVQYIQKLGEVRLDPTCLICISLSLSQNKDDLVYHLTSHLRLNAVYWGLTALCIMGHQDALSRDDMIDFVMSCWDEEAGRFLAPATPSIN